MATTRAGCLSDEVLVEFVERRLPDAQRVRLQDHVQGCPDCRVLVAALVRADPRTDTALDRTQPAAPGSGGWTPPARFDEFRVLRLLGRGAMGDVYLAHDESLGRDVAIKFLRGPGGDQALHEARALARLHHPNVVSVFRTSEVEGRPYLVSELVDGESLASSPLPLPWRRTLDIAIGLARGLAAAHQSGLLHRDVKPANVLIDRSGVVKLVDFGLAQAFDARPDLQAPLAPCGTPRYMAPELFTRSAATPQSDVFSAGVLLLELLTGTAPPRADAGLPPGIDPDFAEVIRRCVATDPAARFDSGVSLRDALERLARFQPAAAGDGSNPYRGLLPFEQDDSALFFGREREIRDVVDRVRRLPLVLVTGDSGVGKSSLCRAGVLAKLVRDGLDGREVTALTLWPGRRPLQALAVALASATGRTEEEWLGALTAPTPFAGASLRDALPPHRALVLLVDQLEELVTESDGPQAERFARALGELSVPSPHVRLLLCVRGDFFTRVCALPGLGDEVERALYLLRPISADGVRDAVVGPAGARGVVFESQELIRTLVANAGDSAGGLPLLQFALAELWERRDRVHRRLTTSALTQMGGVAGALSRHADAVLRRLAPPERQAARELLLLLISAEQTRIGRRHDELGQDSDGARANALRALVDARLVLARTSSVAPTYEIAHDALIRHWPTLRTWVDEDIGHRALRQRVDAATAEWERLGRAEEGLWSPPQLAEAALLPRRLLTPPAREFLRRSGAAVRARKRRRLAGIAAVPLVLGLAYAASWFQATADSRSYVRAHLTAAAGALEEARTHATAAISHRAEAIILFDGRTAGPGKTPGPLEAIAEWSAAERRWAVALEELERAQAAHAVARQALTNVLGRDAQNPEAAAMLEALGEERSRLAKVFMLARLREPASADRGAGRLSLSTAPEGVRVLAVREVLADGKLRLEPLTLGPGKTPWIGTTVPAGSYRLRLEHAGGVTVMLPVLIHPGAEESFHVVLPERIPDGYVWIPAGCFLMGSVDAEDVRTFLSSAPIHRVCLETPYLIGRTEVTFGQWIEYLDSLPPGSPVRRALETPRMGYSGAGVSLGHLPGSGWVFAWHRERRDGLKTVTAQRAKAGERITFAGRAPQDWRRLPLSGVTPVEFEGFTRWLSESGRLPGARLCTEAEWERAARGADLRRYPHSDRLAPQEANIDATYGRQHEAFGPDEVGSHPETASPYGLVDVAGNAFEVARPSVPNLGALVLRGGSWFHDAVSALVSNRTPTNETLGDVTLGYRVCATGAR